MPTLFDRTSETLFYERLSATLALKDEWGSASGTVEAAHYFHDFNKNHVYSYGDANIRLFKGFSLRLYAQAQLIGDQLYLAKAGASEQEILLQRTQLATQFSYYGSAGLSYPFGSIYNNVVNPRFGQ